MAKNNKTVKEVNVEFEKLSERILKLEERSSLSGEKSKRKSLRK